MLRDVLSGSMNSIRHSWRMGCGFAEKLCGFQRETKQARLSVQRGKCEQSDMRKGRRYYWFWGVRSSKII